MVCNSTVTSGCMAFSVSTQKGICELEVRSWQYYSASPGHVLEDYSTLTKKTPKDAVSQ
ncbi:MAG: hypothetical protein WB511_10615 [Nitrososphaeraceae archaeon]